MLHCFTRLDIKEPAKIIAIVLILFTPDNQTICRSIGTFHAENNLMVVMLKFSQREMIFIDWISAASQLCREARTCFRLVNLQTVNDSCWNWITYIEIGGRYAKNLVLKASFPSPSSSRSFFLPCAYSFTAATHSRIITVESSTRPRSVDGTELGNFTLLFCRGRQTDVQKIIKHVHSYCFAQWTSQCLVTLSLPSSSSFA